jgi:hypothetical protein
MKGQCVQLAAQQRYDIRPAVMIVRLGFPLQYVALRFFDHGLHISVMSYVTYYAYN